MNLSFNFIRRIWTNGLIPRLIEQYGSENFKNKRLPEGGETGRRMNYRGKAGRRLPYPILYLG